MDAILGDCFITLTDNLVCGTKDTICSFRENQKQSKKCDACLI